MTRVASLFRVASDPSAAVTHAVAQLKAGMVIAVPTDTIYGLAVSAQHSQGVHELYHIKQRNDNKPIAICVSKVPEVRSWGETDHLPNGLLEALLPGPVTVVLKRKLNLNKDINPDNPLVGIRVPNDKFIRSVCSKLGSPIALTSANKSNEPSSLVVTEFKELWCFLGGVFDGGTLHGSRLGSTVVDLSVEAVYNIIREGSALKETITKLQDFGLHDQCKLRLYNK